MSMYTDAYLSKHISVARFRAEKELQKKPTIFFSLHDLSCDYENIVAYANSYRYF